MSDLRRVMSDQERNLNPHQAAVAAMWLWGCEYASQLKGSMDWWDSLPEADKDLARRMVRDISSRREEPTQ